MVLSIMAVLNPAYYGVRVYPCVLDSRLYPASDDFSGGRSGPLSRLVRMLLGSIRRFEIERDLRVSCYAAGYGEALFQQMKCIF